jgi:hypothetical protein
MTKNTDASGWQRLVEELDKRSVVELFAEHYRISIFIREAERGPKARRPPSAREDGGMTTGPLEAEAVRLGAPVVVRSEARRLDRLMSELDELEGRVEVLEEIAGFDRAQLRLVDAGSVTPSA